MGEATLPASKWEASDQPQVQVSADQGVLDLTRSRAFEQEVLDLLDSDR